MELPPVDGVRYAAFVDASGGGGGAAADAYTIGISHKDGDRLVVDLVRGTSGKLNPHQVTQEYAALCRDYRVTSVVGDRYGREWVASTWREIGIGYENSELTKSEIYLEVIPLFTRGLVRLPNHPRLLRELRLLERQTHRSGRDSVEHPRGQHDDYSNVCCGALRLIGRAPVGLSAVPMSTWTRVLADVDAMPRYQWAPFCESPLPRFP
jgi:hypothetical protein